MITGLAARSAQNIVISLGPSKMVTISGAITSVTGTRFREGMVMMRDRGLR